MLGLTETVLVVGGFDICKTFHRFKRPVSVGGVLVTRTANTAFQRTNDEEVVISNNNNLRVCCQLAR